MKSPELKKQPYERPELIKEGLLSDITAGTVTKD
jgi:hypothetical protein